MCRNLIQRVTTTDHRFLSVWNMIIFSPKVYPHMHTSRSFIWKKKFDIQYLSKYRKKLWHFRNEHRKVGVPEDTLFRTGSHPFPYRKAISGKKGWHAAGLACFDMQVYRTYSNLPENQVSRKQYYLPLTEHRMQRSGSDTCHVYVPSGVCIIKKSSKCCNFFGSVKYM